MRVLVTGAAGFAGQHACRELAAHGHSVIAADVAIPAAGSLPTGSLPLEWVELDVCDVRRCRERMSMHKPDACLHIAGIAFVPNAAAASAKVFEVNTIGTVNLLDAVEKESPSTRVLVVTTSEVYGDTGKNGACAPLPEDTPFAPRNLYGISKAAADQSAQHYAVSRKLDVMVARPSNHTGPGQRPPFVVPAFLERLRALRSTGGGVIHVGNLESKRRFLDVRDVARAYRLLLEKGRGGEAYNISTAHLLRIGDLLDMLAAKLGVSVETEVDAALFRPTDATAALDLSKIEADCGWRAAFELSDTLDAMLAGDELL